MSSLREHQQRRETEEFRNLTPQQRQDSETNFRHTGMLARFHNVMGKQTINTLHFLTTEVVSIFVHPTMVERIAAMLNYFLLHLVRKLITLLNYKSELRPRWFFMSYK